MLCTEPLFISLNQMFCGLLVNVASLLTFEGWRAHASVNENATLLFLDKHLRLPCETSLQTGLVLLLLVVFDSRW